MSAGFEFLWRVSPNQFLHNLRSMSNVVRPLFIHLQDAVSRLIEHSAEHSMCVQQIHGSLLHLGWCRNVRNIAEPMTQWLQNVANLSHPLKHITPACKIFKANPPLTIAVLQSIKHFHNQCGHSACRVSRQLTAVRHHNGLGGFA